MKKVWPMLAVLTMLVQGGTVYGEESADARKIKARNIAVEITAMRSNLASSLIGSGMKVTPKLFREVCGAVKTRAMEIVKEEGVIIRHAAVKNRNPAHAATTEEATILEIFDKNRETTEMWDEITRKGKRFNRYMMPIFVEKACLACHGEKEKRPEFIKKKYPDDRAYGFKEGDLRGMIEVLIPIE